MKKRNSWIGIILLIIVILIGMALADYHQVMGAFEKPIFARPTVTADDGGSGTYQGVLYRFEIEGNFMPEDEYPGVTQGSFYLFGLKIKETIRE